MATVMMHGRFPDSDSTHRQNSQQRRLASILQADHRDVHLRRPARPDQSRQLLASRFPVPACCIIMHTYWK